MYRMPPRTFKDRVRSWFGLQPAVISSGGCVRHLKHLEEIVPTQVALSAKTNTKTKEKYSHEHVRPSSYEYIEPIASPNFSASDFTGKYLI